MTDRAFGFLRVNERESKPRELRDILETMGAYVDIYKFSGGSFALMPEAAVGELIDVCHDHDVMVSTGGSSRTSS